MSGDSLLKMFLVLQYLRRLDALALHYCRVGLHRQGCQIRGNESHYLWEAFIMRFVT